MTTGLGGIGARVRASVARKTLRAAGGATGQRCIDLHNRAARLAGLDLSFARDEASGLHHCDDGAGRHWFTPPQRAANYGRGLRARAQKLSDEYLLQHVPFAAGDRVVDVGANNGDFALALGLHGGPFEVLAIEPAPGEAEAARRNYAAADHVCGVDLRQVGLWSEASGAMVFYLKSGTADSSLIEMPDHDGTIHVEVTTLARILDDGPRKLLKLEAEGAEPEIVAGAGAALRSFEWIVADLGFERGMRQDTTLPQVVHALIEAGFAIRQVGRSRLTVLFERLPEAAL